MQIICICSENAIKKSIDFQKSTADMNSNINFQVSFDKQASKSRLNIKLCMKFLI